MKSLEMGPQEPVNLRGYALVGILALALPLAGLLGSHRLVAVASGLPDAEETVGAPAPAGDCGAAAPAAVACESDGPASLAGRDADGCGRPHGRPGEANPAAEPPAAITNASAMGR